MTGTDLDRSRFFLESSGWNLEVALGSFYETGESDQPAAPAPIVDQEPAAAAPRPSPARRDIGNIRTLESDDDDEDSDMVKPLVFIYSSIFSRLMSKF